MLLVLPPSETKRDGGATGSVLDPAALGFPDLTPHRARALAALRALSRTVAASSASLGLGPTQRFEIDRNRALTTSPVMPAIDRYTGVLYDGLAADTLSAIERAFAYEHTLIASALFGVLRAADPIPAYRLSHDSRLPGMSLRRHWQQPVTAALAAGHAGHPGHPGSAEQFGLLLDLRSESYVRLGPAPASSFYLRVVAEDARGRRLALSHFNKKGKGQFARAVISAGIDHDTVDSLLEWAAVSGIRLEHGTAGVLDLVV